VDRMMGLSSLHHRARSVGQMAFDGLQPSAADDSDLLTDQLVVRPISRKEMLASEKDLVGIYVSEHPLQQLVHDGSTERTPLDQIDESLKGRRVILAGMVSRVRQITTRKGDEMAFMEVEDLSGSVDIVVFPRTYKEYKGLLVEDGLIVVRGKVDIRDGAVQVICDSVQEYVLEDTDQRAPESVRFLEINLRCAGNRDRDVGLLRRVYQILEQRSGSDRFCFNIISDHGCVQLEFPNVTTHFDPDLAAVLQQTLGEDALHVRRMDT